MGIYKVIVQIEFTFAKSLLIIKTTNIHACLSAYAIRVSHSDFLAYEIVDHVCYCNKKYNLSVQGYNCSALNTIVT
jgi:hypothetical protein